MAALEGWVDGPREVAVVGGEDPATEALVRAAWSGTAPGAVVVRGIPGSAHPLLADRGLAGGAPAAYVCRHFVCDAPTTDPAALATALGARHPSPDPA